MAIHYNPTTVSDGLVLALDAANTRSYVGSGTTWTDVSYNGNNGTLTNGPAYTTVGFTEPFGGAGAVYFDGTGDYLSVADDASLQLGSGDFTIEFWIYLNSLSGNPTPIDKAYTGSGVSGVGYLLQYSSSALKFYGGITLTSSTTDTTSVWIHYALVRNSGTITLYRNGVSVASGGDGTNYTYNTSLGIGANILAGAGFGAGAGAINGFISNLRILKGTALYTSNFTPPTKPLTPVSGTSLLTCQGGAIVDNSSNKFSITKNGDARAIQSASIKFDGTNDYASVSHNPSWDIGSTPKTIECWIYFNSVVDGRLIMGQINQWWLSVGWTPGGVTSGKFGISFLDTSSWRSFSSSTSVSSNEWYNVVATWDGTFIRLFVNGNLETTSSNLSAVVWASSSNSTLDIGSYSGASTTYAINGRVSNSRIYNKALSTQEVQQNFNALRGRFGV